MDETRWSVAKVGTDVGVEARALMLVRGDLLATVDAVLLSLASLRTPRGQLVQAFAYNLASLPQGR